MHSIGISECLLHAQHCYRGTVQQREHNAKSRLMRTDAKDTYFSPAGRSRLPSLGRFCRGLALQGILPSVLWDPYVLLPEGPCFQQLSQDPLYPFHEAGSFLRHKGTSQLTLDAQLLCSYLSFSASPED